MRVINIPIEPFEERYSSQWRRWFDREFSAQGIDFVTVDAAPLTSKIKLGSFLDVHGTNYFKAMQTASLVESLYRRRVGEGDWLFFHDLWFPGLESFAYIRDGAGSKFKIAGCLHAGTWDRWDFLSRKGMSLWAAHFEKAFLTIADLIFVATRYHKYMILSKNRDVNGLSDKIKVTGFPIYPEEFVRTERKRENLIVFPHRMDPEKDPEAFRLWGEVWKRHGFDIRFTKEECLTKKEYYQLLARASFAVSFARQETWGIAMQEAVFSNCIPFVPARLSYQEMYPTAFKFICPTQILRRLLTFRTYPKVLQEYNLYLNRLKEKLQIAGATAISNMVKEMEK